MRTNVVQLAGTIPGTQRSISFLHFGAAGARPKCYLQTGLHADEIPGMLVMQHLRDKLIALEANGAIVGEIVLVPVANPIGLTQQVSGTYVGRFCLADGLNFNRGFPDLSIGAIRRLAGALGSDAERNTELVRSALACKLKSMVPSSEHQSLKHTLLANALDADVVLDLHCDTEAVVHLYTATEQSGQFLPLARWLGARAFLVAQISGGNPFDEACSGPWNEIKRHFDDVPFSGGCISATVELRGAVDVSHSVASADADALLAFLRLRHAIVGAPEEPPEPLCEVTPLAGSEPIVATGAGVVVFREELGASVRAGDPIADLVDPLSGLVETLTSPTSGVLYARSNLRWSFPGMRLAKIAGRSTARAGVLLSP
jgi:predicted deacylase